MKPQEFSPVYKSRPAFSLVEVVVAIGIFAIAVISVIGLLAPINQSVTDVKDGDDASRVVSIVQTELQRAGITAVTGFFGQTLYASRSGHKIGLGTNTALWEANVVDENGANGITDETDGQKFFSIQLTRDTTLSPAANDASAGFLAFTIQLRWPAYTGDGRQLTGDALDQQSVLIIPAAINR